MVAEKKFDKADFYLRQALPNAKGYMVQVNRVCTVGIVCSAFKPVAYGTGNQDLEPLIKMNIEMVKGYKESGPGPSKEPSYKIPQFPWPPPKPSAFADIPPRFLLKPDVQTLLKDVAERLKMAFEQAGYGEKSWYQCPDGFALVSRLEQIYSDGSPKEGEVRWIPNVDNLPIFSLGSYLKALFTAPKGHYRVIVFVVTDKIFGPSPQVVSPEEAQAWLSTGSMELPPEIGVQPYTKNHYCKALIYEFEQSNHKPIPKIPSDLQGEDHLKKARLWSALGG